MCQRTCGREEGRGVMVDVTKQLWPGMFLATHMCVYVYMSVCVSVVPFLQGIQKAVNAGHQVLPLGSQPLLVLDVGLLLHLARYQTLRLLA